MWKIMTAVFGVIIVILIVVMVLFQGKSSDKIKSLKDEQNKLSQQHSTELSNLKDSLSKQFEKEIVNLKDENKELKKANDKLANTENVQEGRHIVTLIKYFFSEKDFGKGFWGANLDVFMLVEKDDQAIFPDPKRKADPIYMRANFIPGVEHDKEVTLAKPISFEIDYSRGSKYVVKLSESAIIASTADLTLTKEDSTGYWLLDGKVKFGKGKNSWLEFSDEKIK